MSGTAATSDNEAEKLQQVMGFSSFKSTKGTKVPGNEANWGVAFPAGEAGGKGAGGGGSGGKGGSGEGKGKNAPGPEGRGVEELGRELRRVLGVRGAEN